MAVDQTPLLKIREYVHIIRDKCWELHKNTENIWLLKDHVSPWFKDRYADLFFIGSHLLDLNERYEHMDWEAFIWSPGAFVLVLLGADVGRAEHWKDSPWGWVIWKFRKEHPIFDALLERDFGWIWSYLRDRFPVLRRIVTDPKGWIRDRIDELWQDFSEIRYYPWRWILVKLGADIGRAEFYRDNPVGWILWKAEKRWEFLEALRNDPEELIWRWFRGAVDRFLDLRVPWLIRTCERVLNLIWQTRL